MFMCVQVMPWHVSYIKENLQEEEHHECALLGLTPDEALAYSLKHSLEAYTLLFKNKPLMIYGIGCLDGAGVPWSLGVDISLKGRDLIIFMRICYGQLRRWQRRFSILYNVVGKHHKKSIKWLKTLGFIVEEGTFSPHFLYFYKLKQGGYEK